jgi:hypothetical protein
MSCLEVVNDLIEAVHTVNTEITSNMSRDTVMYNDACIKPNITFDHFFNSLKKKWDRIINVFINEPEKCSTNVQSVLMMYDIASKLSLKSPKSPKSLKSQESDNNTMANTPEKIEQIAYDKMIDSALDMLKSSTDAIFDTKSDMVDTMKSLAAMLSNNCSCQVLDIFMFIVNRYKSKYSKKLDNKSREESTNIIRKDYEYFKQTLSDLTKYVGMNNTSTEKDKLVSILKFSIEDEMKKMIPEELGSMKGFFIKVIVRYFNNLHPIIWAQIFRGMMINIFVDLPMTSDELFSFISKQMLLNSGPFILKILQMIHPALTPEIAEKYNLTKLTYPLLETNQVNLILGRVLIKDDMFKVAINKSASVGHVCIGYDVRKPDEKIVIKIIKPLSISQSCWEYYILHDLFDKGSCEDSFIKNTLKSNGKEMNVSNEIANIDRSNINYTTDYNTEFGIQLDAKLTTITNIKNIVEDGTWFALATTLAPGISLADLIESNMLSSDTKFRAHLHRCLDLLVVKFFYVLVNKGFYHGDLHAGNVFYSYDQKVLTLIDFGAMGDIDLFANNDTTNTILTIIIKSLMYDFDGMLDLLTNILNSKCTGSEQSIDKNTNEYKELKKLLIRHKIQNILNVDEERLKSTSYLKNIDSSDRLNDEASKRDNTLHILKNTKCNDIKKNKSSNIDSSIYDMLEHKNDTTETVIENRDTLPVFADVIGDSKSISFAGVMQLIVTYYAKSGINIAIKFAELNELQKAYALMLGMLAKTGYNSYRMGMAIKTAILNWDHLSKLVNVGTTINIGRIYWKELSKFNEILSEIKHEKTEYYLRNQHVRHV